MAVEVLLYDSGQDQPFTSGRYAAPEQIICEAGGANVMHDVADSWTTIKHRRIFVLDYVDLVESPRNPADIARLGAYLRTAVA